MSGDPVAALPLGSYEGGTSVVGPGETSQADAVVDLAQGTWALICFIEGPDGVPHMANGMLQSFEVVAAEEPAELPEADAGFTLLDYGFAGPESVPGDAVLELTNASDVEPHEMVIARLDDGATTDDVVAALGEESEPPMTPVGGVQALLPGAGQRVQLDLQPGEYVIACGIPSIVDGVPHLEKGMVGTLTVT